jgi:hypothetical protein
MEQGIALSGYNSGCGRDSNLKLFPVKSGIYLTLPVPWGRQELQPVTLQL